MKMLDLYMTRPDADIIRGVGYEIAMCPKPESLLMVDLERVERADRSGVGNYLRPFLHLMGDTRSLADQGSVVAVIDVDDLVAPVEDVQEQVTHGAHGGQGSLQRTSQRQSSVLRRDMLSSVIAGI